VSCAYKDLLAVDLAGIKMKTPVMTASGTCGFGLELLDFLDLADMGALVVKGLTLKPSDGNSGVRVAETPAGLLNAIGLENPGVEAFIAKTLPVLVKYDVPLIANIAGGSVKEYAALAAALDIPGIAGLEINISCPNVKEGGMAFGASPDGAEQVVKAVRKAAGKPLITKLSPNVTDITDIARAVEAAGTDAISLINTIVGMKIDVKKKQPLLGNVLGGLSGPAVRPVAVRMVYQTAQAVKVPLIGMGGILSAEDALEFMLAGASAVAVGTGTFIDPRTAVRVTEGLYDYARAERIDNIGRIVGLALPRA
jgi:dihydroorotate dehydrogenase (NAD+) catalytic subunit